MSGFTISLVPYRKCLSSRVTLFPLPEKLAQAKEENLDMHQVLDQTLLELNNL